MLLQEIGEDILIKTLSFCDVNAVLSVSRVNKFLCRVALTKQVWVYMMHDLVSRGLLDRCSGAELDVYSTQDILDEIKRVVCGPTTWAPESLTPAVHRQFMFDTCLDTDDFFHLELIPGGTHAILKTHEDVRLYDVHTGSCLWNKVLRISSIASDLVGVGEIARILLVPETYSEDINITIQEVNLITGESHEPFCLPLPAEDLSGRWWCTDIQEDFFLLQRFFDQSQEQRLILVDWCSKQQATLAYNNVVGNLQARLLRDYILVTYRESPNPPGQHVIAVIAFSSLDWHPLDLGRTRFSKHNYAAGRKLEFETPSSHNYRIQLLSVYESPLHHDAYRIMIYVAIAPVLKRILLTFTFTPTPPTLHQTVSFHGLNSAVENEISYAGYALQWSARNTRIIDLKRPNAENRAAHVVKFASGWEKMYFSYGALLGVTKGSVVISYFK
ncbi:hypothetical protein K438DRAFT_1844880 [Mycena galopus ATCC 62051]|nr:hypothetical protein K438DRAFT_1844880 [Mycena galopus ATCC 62051]